MGSDGLIILRAPSRPLDNVGAEGLRQIPDPCRQLPTSAKICQPRCHRAAGGQGVSVVGRGGGDKAGWRSGRAAIGCDQG